MSLKNLASNFIINKDVVVPSSKSYANRALILGAMRGDGFKVTNLPRSTDVIHLLAAFKEIGLSFLYENNEVIFFDSFPGREDLSLIDIPVKILTGDGGTTNRFLLALLALGKRAYEIIPSEKMIDRPWDDLLNPLRELGVLIDFHQGHSLHIQGPLCYSENQNIVVNCEKSTQFMTALMLIFSQTSVKIIPQNLNASAYYLKITDDVILKSKASNEFAIPIDFSSLSYPLALGLFMGRVTIPHCFSLDKNQADSIFVEWLREHGADIFFDENGLTITSKNELRPFDVDALLCPDLVPTLLFVASYVNGKSVIRQIKSLRYKESDRLRECFHLLHTFGVTFNYNEESDILTIEGDLSFKASEKRIETARDHRMVMVATLFLLKNKGGTLLHSDCVAKSFPDFFQEVGA